MRMPRSSRLNPLGFLWPRKQKHRYEPLLLSDQALSTGPNVYDGFSSPKSSATPRSSSQPPKRMRFRCCKIPPRILLPSIVIGLLLLGFTYHPEPPTEEEIHEQEELAHKDEPRPADYFWNVFPRINTYFNGVYTLVPWDQWSPVESQREQYDTMPYIQPQQKPASSRNIEMSSDVFPRAPPREPSSSLPLKPEPYNPYPNYNSAEYTAMHNEVYPCYLDANETNLAPDIFAYPGVGQNTPIPYFGSYEELGLRHDICFERFGRFGPYGYGYDKSEGGLGIGLRSERVGVNEVLEQQPNLDWTGMDWGSAQSRCLEKNQARFKTPEEALQAGSSTSGDTEDSGTKKKIPRTAFVFRAWTGFNYTRHEILTLRSTINELALKSGGEYHVHILLHVRDESIPIWASPEVAQKVIEENIPKEFWGITDLWSVEQMRMFYPGPFHPVFDNPSGTDIHEVYRGNHFPLQWFAAVHPEYDFIWNWEMDIRYSGHHYEFHEAVGKWAKEQPRRGLWERNEKMWIPSYHGDWANFTRFVDEETTSKGRSPIWGPVKFPVDNRLEPPPESTPPTSWSADNFEWGVGEEADLITFNPIFDPAKTNWVFREDISGYNTDHPIPPRRCAIITVSRLSRRLLDIMHRETFEPKHSAFPEMWPPTTALHHGLKAVYIPHPVFFDRKWPLAFMDRTFNYPKQIHESPFGWGEHNFIGSSFYYNAGFAGNLWRRWLGETENEQGGHASEISGSGRMCMRPTLFHPIKKENLPE